MNRLFRSFLLCLALALAGGAALAAEETPPATEPEPAATPTAEEPVERDSDSEVQIHVGRGHSDNVVVNVWGDAQLPANEVADGVISIFGDAHVEGEVIEAVVTMFGNARVTGPVHGGVVSLFGNTYIDGPVQEAAVAVFGDLELGPNARIDGDIAVVAGKLTRDPGSVVRGESEIVAGGFPALEGVRLWIEKCLLYGRPLAFERELWWAWAIAARLPVVLRRDRAVVRPQRRALCRDARNATGPVRRRVDHDGGAGAGAVRAVRHQRRSASWSCRSQAWQCSVPRCSARPWRSRHSAAE